MSDITRDYSFGGWLRHFRLEREMTLREAAELLDSDAGNLCKLEKSELDPPKSLQKIATMMALIGKAESTEFMASLAYQHHLAKLKQEFHL